MRKQKLQSAGIELCTKLPIRWAVFFYRLLFGNRRWFMGWSLSRYSNRIEWFRNKVQLAFGSLLVRYKGRVEVRPTPQRVPPFGYMTVYLIFPDRDFTVLAGRSELLVSMRTESSKGTVFSAGLPNNFGFTDNDEGALDRAALLIEAHWHELASASIQELHALNMRSR
jgi:hypothetical protein